MLLFFFLALDSLVGDSPTMDEQNHLARGLAVLRTGDPRLSLEHPPLINGLSALPLLLLPEIRLPTDHPAWEQREGWYAFAEQLLWVYNHDVTRMVFLGRLPIVFLTLGLALTGYHLACLLWGRPAGRVAFLFLLFDPNVLAHGRYSTTDLGGTTFVLLATLLLWRAWQVEEWQWGRVLAAGLGLGLAFGSKLSALVFVPIWGAMALLPIFGTQINADRRRWGGLRRLAQLGVAGVLSLLVIWALFAFEWGPFRFVTEPLAGWNSTSGPMPTFWAGIEQILRLSGGGRPTFLLGRFSQEGFLAYFPVAFLVKTPIPVLLLLPVAAGLLLYRRPTRKRAIFLLVPAVLYFLFSMQSALNIGYRHLLPMLPFVYVVISGIEQRILKRTNGEHIEQRILKRTNGEYIVRYFPYLALVSMIISDLLIHPHYLSYFNVAAGGPANGYNILVDSNVDWGQDLLRLQEWMAENGVEEVKLAWFGSADPAYYGLRYQPLPGLPRHFDLWWDVPFDPAAPEPGVYAISVSNLWELPLAEKTVFPWFRGREPDARIGYSIHIYRVP